MRRRSTSDAAAASAQAPARRETAAALPHRAGRRLGEANCVVPRETQRGRLTAGADRAQLVNRSDASAPIRSAASPDHALTPVSPVLGGAEMSG